LGLSSPETLIYIQKHQPADIDSPDKNMKDFILSMLEKKPDKRPSIKDLLGHSYIKETIQKLISEFPNEEIFNELR